MPHQISKMEDWLQSEWELLAENYIHLPIEKLIFTYRIPKATRENKKLFKPILNSQNNNNNNEGVESNNASNNMNQLNNSFGGYNLPNTMDLLMWGDCHFTKDYRKVIIKKHQSSLVYDVTIFDNYYVFDVLNGCGNIILTFTNTMLFKNDLNCFRRVHNNYEYLFYNNKLTVKQIQRKCSFIKKTNGDFYIDTKYMTMDLETMITSLPNGDTKLVPYYISYYDGNAKTFKQSSFYLTDYENNSEKMIEECLKSLMIRKYDGYKVYIHNFSRFDAIFILKIIVSLFPKVVPIVKDDQIINLKCYYGPLTKNNKYPYQIFFRDSYLLLPSKLSTLAKNFDVSLKGLFPYLFVTDQVSLNYKGPIPDFKYFDKCTQEEYNNYCETYKKVGVDKVVWDLKAETIKYCQLDCKALYEVLLKFNKYIFDITNINIHKSPTLSSLALKMYKTKYMAEENLPILTGQIYEDIKRSYTGGSVDVYNPQFNVFDNKEQHAYYYDVNSLYPFVMLNNPMPVGESTYVEYDNIDMSEVSLLKNGLENPFGILFVEIETPKELEMPILQTKIRTSKDGFRTVAPLGKWTGWYFSEELFNALKFGYKIKIIKGYLFEKAYIFNDYVESFYKIKKESAKGTVQYTVAKLILNSLYGKLGMNPDLPKHEIVESKGKDYYKILPKMMFQMS